MVEFVDVVNVGLFAAALRMATPVALTALGGIFSERVGIVNIGLEGMMLTGAFCGVAVSFFTGDPWLGVLAAVLTGGLLGLLHAVLVVRFVGNQIVSGVAINIFAMGFTAFMSQVFWGSRGASESVQGVREISIPFLKDVPLLGQIIGKHTPFVYLMLLVTILSYVLLFRTPFGLRVRAVGEHPAAADSAGVNVFGTKYLCVVLSGMLAGLGGAFLSLGHLNLFAWGMTGGRGFIAMAAMIFGKWMPFGAFWASLLFGFSDALQMRLQALGLLPSQIILSIPYILTVAVLAGAVGRAVPPSDYKPYVKERTHGKPRRRRSWRRPFSSALRSSSYPRTSLVKQLHYRRQMSSAFAPLPMVGLKGQMMSASRLEGSGHSLIRSTLTIPSPFSHLHPTTLSPSQRKGNPRRPGLLALCLRAGSEAKNHHRRRT